MDALQLPIPVLLVVQIDGIKFFWVTQLIGDTIQVYEKRYIYIHSEDHTRTSDEGITQYDQTK